MNTFDKIRSCLKTRYEVEERRRLNERRYLSRRKRRSESDTDLISSPQLIHTNLRVMVCSTTHAK
jgi:hypothetical protein